MTDIEQVKFELICRTLDGWLLMNEGTIEAVTAWLESVNIHQVQEVDILDATEISE